MNLRAPLQKLRLASLITVLNLAACGDSGSASETTGPTTGAPSTSEPGTDTGPVTTGTTGEPTTSPTGGQTEGASSSGGVSSSSGEPGTSTGEGPLTGGDTSSSGEPGSSSGGSTGDTGGELTACKTDADCTLVDDCCSCEPIGPGEPAPACDLQRCLVNTCNGYGLEGAALACRFGRCTFAKIACNPLGVNCNAPKPQCAPGEVPSVLETDDGKCWTGSCVPAEACDWVPDCSYCDDDELVCVGKLQKGAYSLCEPKPLDCGDADDIDCTCGQQICDASPPHTVCHDAADDISCECPFC